VLGVPQLRARLVLHAGRVPRAYWIGERTGSLGLGRSPLGVAAPLRHRMGGGGAWRFLFSLAAPTARDHLSQLLLTYGMVLLFNELQRAPLFGNEVHGVRHPRGPPRLRPSSRGSCSPGPAYRAFTCPWRASWSRRRSGTCCCAPASAMRVRRGRRGTRDGRGAGAWTCAACSPSSFSAGNRAGPRWRASSPRRSPPCTRGHGPRAVLIVSFRGGGDRRPSARSRGAFFGALLVRAGGHPRQGAGPRPVSQRDGLRRHGGGCCCGGRAACSASLPRRDDGCRRSVRAGPARGAPSRSRWCRSQATGFWVQFRRQGDGDLHLRGEPGIYWSATRGLVSLAHFGILSASPRTSSPALTNQLGLVSPAPDASALPRLPPRLAAALDRLAQPARPPASTFVMVTLAFHADALLPVQRRSPALGGSDGSLHFPSVLGWRSWGAPLVDLGDSHRRPCRDLGRAGPVLPLAAAARAARARSGRVLHRDPPSTSRGCGPLG